MADVTDALRPLIERDPALRFRYNDELGVIAYLRGDIARIKAPSVERIRDAGLAFVAHHKDLFGSPSLDTRLATAAEDPDGGRTVVLDQLHGQHPVFGGSVRFHVTGKGVLDTIENRLFPDLDRVGLSPDVGAGDAVKAAQAATQVYVEPSETPLLKVYRHERAPRLVWEIKLNDDDTRDDQGLPRHMIAYVDAVTGEPLLQYNNIQTAGPIVASGTGYYSGAGPVNAWFNDTTNQLRDTTRTGSGGPEVITNDEDGASPSEDTDANWADLTTTPRDHNQGAEVDAHRYAANVIDHYQLVHARNSWNGAGGNISVIAHLGTNYNNGYWDGSKINLGDGDGSYFDYCTTDDWLAHELTHGYTQATCGLQYINESGALNEAFSDVMAAFITGDWLVFEDNWLAAFPPACRNMIDPTNGGGWNVADAYNSVINGYQPSHYSVRYTGGLDNGGVHMNSGIINNLFYLLSMGGTHTVSGVVVSAIGTGPAEELLWRCMTVNLVGNPGATFLDFRRAMLDACQDLFPTNLFILSQVKNAFNAVGIGPDLFVRDNLADTGLEPYPGSYLWASPDIINRTTPSANPAVDFANLGNDSLWQNVEFGQDNSVYVRVQTRGPASGDATVRVYFSAASTFGTPASWIYIGVAPAVGIAPGGMQVVGPITFAQGLIPGVGHYCMIAIVSDAADPAPDHTLIASLSDYLNYVRSTNNIAYRNMDVVDAVPGAPGILELLVQTLAGRELFDLRFNFGDLAAYRSLRVIAPLRMLAGAEARGLRLIEKSERGGVFIPAPRWLRDVAPEQDVKQDIGFDQVLVEEPFAIWVEFELGELAENVELRRFLKRRNELVVRQVWKGQVVGAAGVRFVPNRVQEADDRLERLRAKTAESRRPARLRDSVAT